MGEQAIEPIGGFAHVFQDQDCPLQMGQVAGAEQVGGHGEVAGQQGAGGAAATPAHPLQIGQGVAEEQVPQPLAAPLGFAGQAGDQRAMDGAALAPGRLGPEQGGDIGEAQQPARRQLQGLFQQPGRPPAAADAGQQGGLVDGGCRWGQAWLPRSGREQITAALPVGAGQVAPAAQGLWMGLHLQAPALQHRDAVLEALQVVEGGAGRHQAHPIAAAQGRRLPPGDGARSARQTARHGQRPSTRANNSREPSQTCWLKWRP